MDRHPHGIRPVLVGMLVWPLLSGPGRLLKQSSVEICEGERGMDLRQAGSSSVSLTISKGLALQHEGGSHGLRWNSVQCLYRLQSQPGLMKQNVGISPSFLSPARGGPPLSLSDC